MTNTRVIGLSLPEGVVDRIDRARGDISRSKYILRIIERAFGNKVIEYGGAA
jgi:hypothetical protein